MATLQKFTNTMSLVLTALVIHHDIIYQLGELRHALKCSVHAAVVVLRDGWDAIRCSQIHPASEWGSEYGEQMTFLVQGTLIIPFEGVKRLWTPWPLLKQYWRQILMGCGLVLLPLYKFIQVSKVYTGTYIICVLLRNYYDGWTPWCWLCDWDNYALGVHLVQLGF